jgi:DNA processing protein
LVLFYKGNLNFGQRKLVSIVGTRSGDPQGEKICRELVAGMREFDPIIVPGFARCIDIIAHDQALKSNLTTIACMANGLDQIYTPEHKVFSNKIEEEGGFISEFTTEEKFDRKHFLIRNRIIAGLSHATVVIQSQSKGGTMITANFSYQYNRELFSFPCEVGNPLHQGCHDLIRSQKAQLITGAEDLVKGMGWESESVSSGVQKTCSLNLMKRKSHF